MSPFSKYNGIHMVQITLQNCLLKIIKVNFDIQLLIDRNQNRECLATKTMSSIKLKLIREFSTLNSGSIDFFKVYNQGDHILKALAHIHGSII